MKKINVFFFFLQIYCTFAGYYVFSEASPAAEDDKANLVSRVFPPILQRCIKFFYHMYGDGMGTLNVLLDNTKTGTLKTIFTKSGNQGNQWIEGKADIASSDDYRV